MGCTVSTDKTGSIQCKCHIQILQGNVVNQLVICPLQKSRVDGDNRFQTFAGQSCRECDSMLLGNTHVEKSVRIVFRELNHSGTFFHGRSNADQFFVNSRHITQPVAEYVCVRRLG